MRANLFRVVTAGRMWFPCYLLLAFLKAFPICSEAQVVEQRDGNIYFLGKDRALRQVTSDGIDRYPAVSPDGTRIVFVRIVKGPFFAGDPEGRADIEASQLWIYDIARGGAPKLLLDGPIKLKGRKVSAFYRPQFSADGEYVYFSIQLAATPNAIARLTLATRSVVYIMDALDFSVVSAGEYKGDLIVQQRRPKLGVGYYYWFYLLKPTGQEIGVIGEDKDDAYNFLDMYVGDLSSCQS